MSGPPAIPAVRRIIGNVSANGFEALRLCGLDPPEVLPT